MRKPILAALAGAFSLFLPFSLQASQQAHHQAAHKKAAAAAAHAGPVVRIASGRVRGKVERGVDAFLGIPFAQPPIGKLRWRAPQPVKGWDNIRSATQYGPDCMQLPFPGDAAPLGNTPSENCLYLNVWRPRNATGKHLPVMVWIYGGGFVNGGSSPSVYDGYRFAQDGLVFVSFNYRLGRFGFFAFPALLKEQQGQPLGNYAFLDQIAALKWVQQNIGQFGGDPNQVTIFGESAGGMSVNMLMTSPLARGLFERAMVESGGGRDNILPPPQLNTSTATRPSAVQLGVNFARHMGIHGTGAAALAALRRLSAHQIVDGINMASMGKQRDIYSGPMIDGKIMPEPVEQAYKEGKEVAVPIVTGANSMDIGPLPAANEQQLFSSFGAQSQEAQQLFDPSGKAKLMALRERVGSERIMLEPARFVAASVAQKGQPTYVYRFSYVATSMRPKWPGAPHATEIPFAFDTVRFHYGKKTSAQDEQMARTMHAYWVNFAKTGNPNGAGLAHWPRYSQQGDGLMIFTPQGTATGGRDPWEKQMNLVEKSQK